MSKALQTDAATKAHASFLKLDAVLDKQAKYKIWHSESKYDEGVLDTTHITEQMQIFDFGRIKIARSIYTKEGMERLPPMRDELNFYTSTKTFYYVVRDNKLVTDEREVKNLIKQITNVELLKTNTDGYEYWPMSFPVYHAVITNNMPAVPQDDSFATDHQPTNQELAKQVDGVRRYINTLPARFGYGTLEELLSKLPANLALADKLLRGDKTAPKVPTLNTEDF